MHSALGLLFYAVIMIKFYSHIKLNKNREYLILIFTIYQAYITIQTNKKLFYFLKIFSKYKHNFQETLTQCDKSYV